MTHQIIQYQDILLYITYNQDCSYIISGTQRSVKYLIQIHWKLIWKKKKISKIK